MQPRGTLIRCKAMICPQRFWETQAERADAAQRSSTCLRTDHCSQVKRWAGVHTASQEVVSNRQISWLSPRGQGGRQSKQGRKKSLLAKGRGSLVSGLGALRQQGGTPETSVKKEFEESPNPDPFHRWTNWSPRERGLGPQKIRETPNPGASC